MLLNGQQHFVHIETFSQHTSAHYAKDSYSDQAWRTQKHGRESRWSSKIEISLYGKLIPYTGH